MQQEFGVEVEWLGYELWPQSLEWPEDGPAVAPPANRPPTPTKLSLLCLLDGVTIPVRERPKKMRTFNAHQAVEYAKSYGVQEDHHANTNTTHTPTRPLAGVSTAV